MLVKNIGSILISVFCGCLIGFLVISICVFTGIIPKATGGGSALPTPNLDNTVITILKVIFGGIYGLLTSLTVLFLIAHILNARLSLFRIILLTLIFGLIHSAFFTLLEFNNAAYGQEPGTALTAFERTVILKTAILELITGSLIGLASILILIVGYQTKK